MRATLKSISRSVVVAVLFGLVLASAAQPGWSQGRGARSFAAGEAALSTGDAAAAVRHFRRALKQGLAGRTRFKAQHGLASALIRMRRYDGAEPLVKEARAGITRRYGADDILMARNWLLTAMIRHYRYRDRAGAQRAFAKSVAIRNAKVRAWARARTANGAPAVRHIQSGLVAPLRLGGFRLVQRVINNDDGTDVSLNYDGKGPNGPVRLTIYAYKGSERTFRRQFSKEKTGIRRFNTSAALRREGAVRAGRRAGRMALFGYRGRGVTVSTRLYLFPLRRGGLVKLRVTHNAADDAHVDAAIARLLPRIGWPR